MELDGHEYLTVKEFLRKYPSISNNMIRSWIRDRDRNGLGMALYMPNRKQFLIRDDLFLVWWESRRADRAE